ncbi:MAG: bifunctional 3-(3-hydroxy-phenyl)propionate/3-hydroxycinnamic acid hydroxylase, partial [Bacteroidetes bacterium]
MHTLNCDIIIVGLGPTGAVLANILGAYGWSVVGIEREPAPCPTPRAVHFDDETMRIFQFAGLAAEIAQTSEPFREMEFVQSARHKPLARGLVGTQDKRYGYPGAFSFHQPTLEAQLRQGLKRFENVHTCLGYEVHEVQQDEQQVQAFAHNQAGQRISVRGRYLVGCDGGKSLVRKSAGLPLTSANFDQPWVVVDCKTRSGQKDPTLPRLHRQYINPRQPVTYIPLAGPYYEWQFMLLEGQDAAAATEPAYVQEQLRPFVDLSSMELVRVACYHFHALWLEQWVKGRIILAGDAAHQMPPFLGQGMCSGIRDAGSLAWRLDMMLRGTATETLLHSYQSERLAHVKHLIKGAMFLGSIIQTRQPWKAFLRNNLLLRPTNYFPAFKRLVTEAANRKRPLERGLIGRHHKKIAGHLFIQPEVALQGQRQLLDEYLGRGFAVLARAPLPAAVHARLQALLPGGGRVLTFSGQQQAQHALHD